MAITSRSTLETAVDNWLARDDIASARKQEFIALFEAVANRRLRVRQMEASATFTTSDGAASLATIASDYLAFRSLTWGGSTNRELDFVHPTYLRAAHPNADSADEAGTPTVFTIEGSTLTIRPTDDTTDAFTLRYYQKLDALDADGATNWLLTDFPDCYLAGTLHEAQIFLQDAQSAILWKAKRDELFSEIELLSERGKAPSAIRPLGAIV